MKKNKKVYNPKSLTEIARDNIRIHDKQLNKELAKKMLDPYFFTDRSLGVGFKTTLDSHHINHTNSKLTNTTNYPEFGIEFRYINKIMKELAMIYSKLLNQYKFRYQTVFSARDDKQNEDGQFLDETKLYINLNNNHKLTETYINNVNVVSPLEYQIQQQEMKDSGWRFDKKIQ